LAAHRTVAVVALGNVGFEFEGDRAAMAASLIDRHSRSPSDWRSKHTAGHGRSGTRPHLDRSTAQVIAASDSQARNHGHGEPGWRPVGTMAASVGAVTGSSGRAA